MAATVVYFGTDEAFRVPVLMTGGYDVFACGSALNKLQDTLRQNDVDAVAVSEASVPDDIDIASLARAATSAPLILFQGASRKLDALQFDSSIPPQTDASDWLKIIATTIEQSRASRAKSELLRSQSTVLREQSAAVRQNAKAFREQSSRGQLLTSWKEIARYVGKGVRTVQRWESQFGFPVHRLSGSHVLYVVPNEVDAWVRSHPTHNSGVCQIEEQIASLEAKISELEAENSQLRLQVQSQQQGKVLVPRSKRKRT